MRGGLTWYSEDDVTVTASFLGAPGSVAPFTIAANTDDVQADVNAGVEMISGEDSTLRLFYDGHFGDRLAVHAAGLQGKRQILIAQARRSATKRAASMSMAALSPKGWSASSASATSPASRALAPSTPSSADERGLAARRVLGHGLAHGLGVALRIEQIVGELEGLAERARVGFQRGAASASARPSTAPASQAKRNKAPVLSVCMVAVSSGEKG